MARLGDVCTIVSGTTPKSDHPEYWDGDINWVTPAELTDESDTIFESQRKITQQAVSDSSLKPFPAGTVLLSSRAPIGKVAIAGVEMYCNQGFKNLICSDVIYNRYLYHFLKGKTDYLNSLGRGATFKEISKSIVEGIEIPLPPLDEQRKIAAVLDKVSDLIAQRRKQLDKLDELVKARFSELLSVIDCIHSAEPLENYLENITYGFTNPMPDSKEGPWKITAKDIADRKINFSTARKTTTEAFEGLTEKSKPLIDDVLLTKDGTLGRMAIVEDANICVNQSVAVLRCNKRVMPKILMYLLQMPEYQQKMISNAGGGTIKHIYITKVGKMLVNIPNIETQKAFLYFAEQTEKTKTTISRSLEKLEMLKKAMMQEYFG